MTISRFLRLNTGHKMPTMGFGTFMLQGNALKEALDYALFVGYRHIDTAPTYGNEEDIGEVIDDRIRSGKVKRKELFITTKLSRHSLERPEALQCAEKSLDALRTTYLDMYLCHHPWGCTLTDTGSYEFKHVDINEPWSALVDLFKSGKALSVGVSNFTIKQLDRIISSSKIVPANVQLECHPYLAQKRLTEYCTAKGIAISAYAPLGAVSRPDKMKTNSENLLEDPVIVEIAQKHKKTPSQILLNFLLHRGFAVLPKSENKDRLKENFAALSFTISSSDYDRIFSLDRRVRFFEFLYMKGHPEFDENEDF